MKIHKVTALGVAACLGVSTPAMAASDYLLKLDGVDGEAAVSGEIVGYSWGMSNPGTVAQANVTAPRDMSSGQASGKREAPSGLPTGKRTHKPAVTVTASQNTQSLRESPTRASTGGVAVAAGDLDGDGVADFLDATRVAEVDGFTLTFDKASPVLARLCANGKHFPKATIVARGQELVIEHGTVSGCAAGAAQRIAIDGSMPNRISMNVTVPKQTQGATFGEKVCAGMACPAPEVVTVTITGQMKHTKSGHVTLLK